MILVNEKLLAKILKCAIDGNCALPKEWCYDYKLITPKEERNCTICAIKYLQEQSKELTKSFTVISDRAMTEACEKLAQHLPCASKRKFIGHKCDMHCRSCEEMSVREVANLFTMQSKEEQNANK